MSFLLHQGATVICTHSGQASPTMASTRVKLGGQAATTLAHSYTIAGCTFATPEPSPKPCATVQWSSASTRVKIEGQPALFSISQGITIGPMGTQGTPMTTMQQTRVKAQ